MPASSTLASHPATDAQGTTTMALVSLAHGLSHFGQLVLPPLFPWLALEFGLSNTRLGLLMTVFYGVSFFGQAAAGFVVDRHGARRVLFGGVALIGLAAAGLAASPGYTTMLAFMALAGLGNCVFHPVDFSILNARLPAHRLGPAYAAHGVSGNVGWALAPLFVVGLAQALGWRAALFGVSLLVAAVLGLMFWQRQALDVPRVAAVGGSSSGAASRLGFLRLRSVWSCFAFFFTAAIALGAMQSFAPAAAGQLHQVPAAQVALCLSAYMLASAGGMLLGGQLARQPGRSTRLVSWGYGSAAGVALAMALLPWPPQWVPLLFMLMGAGAGLAGPSRDLLIKQATPAGATGRVYGVVYSGLDVGTSLAPLLFGALMDAGQYRWVWLLVALVQGLLIANAFNVNRQAPAVAPARPVTG
ncbi:sugar phosphate permease [Burkholderiales bacterium JOSHI_001]|nr:sugar phosphate permease [Burkholderiales bacterium JOSHI_001]